MLMTTTINDEETLRSIVNDLGANLMVEAGAGTGKTYALVSRVVALVKAGVRMQNIVAITFTDAAAAELSERVRSRMELLLGDGLGDSNEDLLAKDLTEQERGRIRQAVSELDQAAVQTIHSFAAQLLRDRPLSASLPPGWVPLDAVDSTQRFAERWDQWLEGTLGQDPEANPELRESLRYLIGVKAGIGTWRQVAKDFADNYDRLASEGSIAEIDLHALGESTLGELEGLRAQCVNDSDSLFEQISSAIETVTAVLEVADRPLDAIQTLDQGATVDFSGNSGSSNRNWTVPTAEIRKQFREEIGRPFQIAVRCAPALTVLQNLRQSFALRYTAQRKAEGVAFFDDLLVWARDLLRDGGTARRRFQDLYTHILIDEFQDTDPLQAEIAFYLAAMPDANIDGQPWHTVPLTPGKLFIVGDSKQSIYRFRRADIGVTHLVRESGQLRPLTLTENRRSQKPVLDWVNAVFSQIMTEETGLQAEYVPLQLNPGLQRNDLESSVQVFGEPMDLSADALRRRQARHVASITVDSVAEGSPNRLRVYDKERRDTRQAALQDVCILIRSRTGLGILTRALEAAGVPYRLEGNSLVFGTQEVQDLLNCLRAIDDPSDQVSVVATLRSPAFACSDVDLARWRDSGGTWNYQSNLLDEGTLVNENREKRRQRTLELGEAFPVRTGLLKIRAYHQLRQTIGVARLIANFIREMRLEELDLAENRPREVWRRRRFLGEQARQLEYASETNPGAAPLTLNTFLQWADMQQEEGTRITDVTTPEADDDAVRIMTMHAAKGLEFPIVILLGLEHNPSGIREAVLFNSSTGSTEVKLGGLQTPGYSTLEEREKVHDAAELVRLAYVGSTRARDHLIVSTYQSTARPNRQSNGIVAQIHGLCENAPLPHAVASANFDSEIGWGGTVSHTPARTEYDPGNWQSERADSIHRRSFPQAVTATRIAKALAPNDVEIDDKDSESITEPSGRAGRGGTAFGSALHAVLQGAVEQMSLKLPLPGDVLVDDLLADLDPAIEQLAQQHAKDQGVSASSDDVARLANRALRSPAVVAGMRAPRLWPEIPVAASIDTPRGPVVIEGIIDLLYQDDDGQLVILDYKSDRVDDNAAADAKLEHYRMQGVAYAAAVESATGNTVKAVQFLFVQLQDGLREIDNLRDSIDGIAQTIVHGMG
jgi:ATP-dependent helicase/nuclease subunit A